MNLNPTNPGNGYWFDGPPFLSLHVSKFMPEKHIGICFHVNYQLHLGWKMEIYIYTYICMCKYEYIEIVERVFSVSLDTVRRPYN